jgi:hypothetical protein
MSAFRIGERNKSEDLLHSRLWEFSALDHIFLYVQKNMSSGFRFLLYDFLGILFYDVNTILWC